MRDEQEQYRHNHGIHTLDVTLRDCFQTQMISADGATQTIARNISDLLRLSLVVEDVQLLNEIKLLREMQSSVISPIEIYYFRQESLLCDVPEAIHDDLHDYGPPRNRTINSLSDYDALHMTNFTKKQLLRIYRCFNFGYEEIRIHHCQRHYYCFDPEYIFLFGLAKMSSGLDNLAICHLFFGGSPRRMSNAFKWFLIRLYDRYYETVISYQGLSREVSNFPYYSTKIAKRFNQERFLIDNNTGERYDFDDYELMDESKCRIAMLIDGSVTETCTLGTGPNGNYHGSMRKDHAYIKQRSIYSGYKKQHGLSSLMISMPTGIHYMYGPCSMRQSDSALVLMSDVDQFLVDIQTNRFPFDQLYAAYGDKLFRLSRCIIRAHKGDVLNPITRQQEMENSILNGIRITIEHCFAVLCNRWRIMNRYEEFKLGQENPHAKELLSVAYLLSNICVTLQGSQVTGSGTFFCVPPSLEEYLDQGDEDDLE